ncbi:MAG: ribosomal protein S18-alanine N-acetyltransferase [Nitrospirales bacterium]|nr:ribosomal protein S18-alanine N-acetyltransferase [Nitrospirales bacterium]
MIGQNQELKCSISKASLEDLEAILEIEQISFSVPWSRKAFEAELEGNEFSVILTARLEVSSGPIGPVVGYICFWLIFEELRFLNLAIIPAWRRHGVASQLVSQAMRLGFRKGTRRGLLEVRESNLAAQALYKKFGFTVYAMRKSYYTNPDEDAILMSLEPITGPILEVSKLVRKDRNR